MTEPKRVAFLGLGVMGYPMARHLAKAGHDVTVYNRTQEKAQRWVSENGGRAAATPAEAAADRDIVFACVGNDDDLRQVALGEQGAFAGMRFGSIFCDHTTASADVARELETAGKERGIGVLDAPVSGGQAGAENGQLTIMIGGNEGTFLKVEPVIQAYAKAAVHMGPAGAGQLTKMVNQICIAGVVQGLAEAINFGQRAGLDMEKAIAAISKGAAQSWQMENRYKTMIEGRFEFGFAVDWMRKDLGIVLDTAKETGARLPMTALVDQFYAQVQARGGNRWDTSSLIQLLQKD
jgi:3-hydroxyisobutyrate dehydrogenase